MAPHKQPINKIRASRDGHEFHENWAARKALQLISPKDGLIGIAVEGLDPFDERDASEKTIEIADLTLYYGKYTTFESATKVQILQLKYSIGKENVPFRFADAKETVRKFVASFKKYKKQYGAKAVRSKLRFDLITNRPIFPGLAEAIKCISQKSILSGVAKLQAKQFTKTCGLKGKDLVDFAEAISFTGLAGNLPANKISLEYLIANWSGGRDAESRARLGAMKQLVRDKAGHAGTAKNVLRRTDILDVFGVGEDELFPCSEAFPKVGPIVAREQLPDAIKFLSNANSPVLIHATAGMGKTVFLQSIAAELSKENEVYVFDCFGGGAYRAREDSRHLPKRGLAQIANTFSVRGLCDPLIPSVDSSPDLIKAFRLRLAQCVEALRSASRDKKLYLFIDAADNAADYANERKEDCFPKLLLESFVYNNGIPGVQLVLSCRTERRPLVKGDVDCNEFQLKPFSLAETDEYLRRRVKNIRQSEVQVAQSRSEGTPRILEHLVISDRGLLEQSEVNKIIKLDAFLEERIEQALAAAKKLGHKADEIDSLLAGLAVLPPPVPVAEFAAAQRVDINAINSFAADLAPMIEKTKHGIWFRDEPTETFIRNKYAQNKTALHAVASNLLEEQDKSVYAARALPHLLYRLGDGKRLSGLAFSNTFPRSITSTVGKQSIRHARLKAAISFSTEQRNYNDLVRLLVELSTIEAGNEKGINYIIRNPDLVVVSNDIDAARRLFEARTSWQGTRHARLTITHLLQDETGEALRHAIQADEWIRHSLQDSDHHQHGPEAIDIAAMVLCLIAQDRYKHAASYLKTWKDWFVHEVASHVFALLSEARVLNLELGQKAQKFLSALSVEIGALSAALSFPGIVGGEGKTLIKKLANACRKKTAIEQRETSHREYDSLEEGLLRAAVIGLTLGMKQEASVICTAVGAYRPTLATLASPHFNPYSNQYIYPFLYRCAVEAAASGRKLEAKDILPREIFEIFPATEKFADENAFRKRLKEIIFQHSAKQVDNLSAPERRAISHESQETVERFVDERLPQFMKMLSPLVELLDSASGRADDGFIDLVSTCRAARLVKQRYGSEEISEFLAAFCKDLLIFVISARTDLSLRAVTHFVDATKADVLWPGTLTEITAILARRPHLQELAGKIAQRVCAMIEKDDDVNSRVAGYARLAHAILPASRDDANVFFRTGLEQMDIVGSGDYDFVNGLLTFSSQITGNELKPKDGHTFSNLCELNIYEVEKFDWGGFGIAFAKIAGLHGLAKLGRWDDREKVPLRYSLMPFLTALIKLNKIEPDLALCLLWLCDPIETWTFDYSHFTSAVLSKSQTASGPIVAELMSHFTASNFPLPHGDSVKKVISALETITPKPTSAIHTLSRLLDRASSTIDEYNSNYNYTARSTDETLETQKRLAREKMENKKRILQLIRGTSPSDAEKLTLSIEHFQGSRSPYDFREVFFDGLRSQVSVSERKKYIDVLVNHQTLNLHWKLEELKKCKDTWTQSSVAIKDVFTSIATPLLATHREDLISYSYLSVSTLKDIATLSNRTLLELAMELIQLFASSDVRIPANIWMALAAMICEKVTADEAQNALTRLLESNAAKLASSVSDGEWKEDLYPKGNHLEIIAGLVWLKLGAAAASDRWRAAHAVRTLARMGRWDVIAVLVGKLNANDAGSFQAPELKFYYLHARLWLLIALARVAMDIPDQVSRLIGPVKAVALDSGLPHVVIRHFAARIVITCLKAGTITLSQAEQSAIETINRTPFPFVPKDDKGFPENVLYQGRPESAPKQVNEFGLEYEFHKNEVNALCRVFRKKGWEMDDMITSWVRKFDTTIEHMRTTGGREKPNRRESWAMTAKYHIYGEYLGWHCLYLSAGTFLSNTPLTQKDTWYSWDRWLRYQMMTREDGLWLADGTDLPPLDTLENLLEKGKAGLELTGSAKRILQLIGIDKKAIPEAITVVGHWESYDGISVSIDSALVAKKDAARLAKKFAGLNPYDVWFPQCHIDDEGHEYIRDQVDDYEPWIISESSEARLDDEDPLGSINANLRPRVSKKMRTHFGLNKSDAFGRKWTNSSQHVVCWADAWGKRPRRDDETSPSGYRLKCSKQFLSEVLKFKDKELLIYVKLRHYVKGNYGTDGHFFHSLGVVRITEELEIIYYKGRVNYEVPKAKRSI